MKKSLKQFIVVLLLVALVIGGWIYNQGKTDFIPDVNPSLVKSYMNEPAITSLEDDVVVMEEFTSDEQVVIYEVRVRLEDLSLYSNFPSFNDGEESFDARNYIFNGEEGMLRSVLVSMNPALDFFKVGDVLMLGANMRELALAVPGDVVTFYCEVKVSEYVCDELNDPSCLALFELTSCMLVKINH